MGSERGANRRRIAGITLIGVLMTFTGAPTCQAQAASGPPTSVFQKLFPTPTGENGYEEIVQAGELARGSARLAAAIQPGASLTTMRNALADPPVAHALRLLRAGIAKPILAIRQSVDEDTIFPELPSLRDLGRLLKVEQYVLLAEGHNAAAIESMSDALKLAQAIQSNFALSGLVGISIDAIAVESIARHLEVFSLPDCNHLLRLLDAWLALPSPLIRLLQGERDFDIAILRNKREDSDALTKLLKYMLSSAQNPPVRPSEINRLTGLMQWIETSPQTVMPVVDKAIEMVDSTYQQAFRTLPEPTWTWKDPQLLDETGPAGQLASTMIMPVGSIMERYIIDRAKIQMLAVQAAIRRFQWENDRLPGSLQELKIGDRALDPFTGNTLLYTLTSNTYALSSAGGRDRDATQMPPSGGRIPLSLTPNVKP